jgi:hypothetical protein
VELYIDRGEAERNKMVFNTFMLNQTEIEQIFGEPLIDNYFQTTKQAVFGM